MLHNFLECTFVMKQKDVWLSALAVSHINSWMCYVGSMDGTIEIYRKGNEYNEAEHRTAVFTGQLTKYKRWEHVHSLGITMIHIVFEEGYLITLSNDHSAKILDQHLGNCLHVINNSHNCKYTGLVWDSRNFRVFLGDEQGHLEVWSSFHEKKLEDLPMEHWRAPRREATSSVNGPATAIMSIAQLVALPLIGAIQGYKSADCLVSLNPRTGIIRLWQVRISHRTAHLQSDTRGLCILCFILLAISALCLSICAYCLCCSYIFLCMCPCAIYLLADATQTTAEATTVEFAGHGGQLVLGMAVLETAVEAAAAVESAAVVDVIEVGADGSSRKNFQVLKLQSRQQPEGKSMHSAVSLTAICHYLHIDSQLSVRVRVFVVIMFVIRWADFSRGEHLLQRWRRQLSLLLGRVRPLRALLFPPQRQRRGADAGLCFVMRI
jgi:hypothetical protein